MCIFLFFSYKLRSYKFKQTQLTLDIRFSAYNTFFLEQHLSGMLKSKYCKAKYFFKSLGARKARDKKTKQNSVKKGYGHICMREENLSFINIYIIQEQYINTNKVEILGPNEVSCHNEFFRFLCVKVIHPKVQL